MSAADDLRKLGEAYPKLRGMLEEHATHINEFGACYEHQLAALAAKLYAETEEAREMLTFYCADYCTCRQDPHVGSDADGLDPPCLTVLVKEWLAKHGGTNGGE